jgi:hypothetical protein
MTTPNDIPAVAEADVRDPLDILDTLDGCVAAAWPVSPIGAPHVPALRLIENNLRKLRHALAAPCAAQATPAGKAALDVTERVKTDWRYGYLCASDATRGDAEVLASDSGTAQARVESDLTEIGRGRGGAGVWLGNDSLLAIRRVLEDLRALEQERAAAASRARACHD